MAELRWSIYNVAPRVLELGLTHTIALLNFSHTVQYDESTLE